jgi:uncharacterized protein YwgA
MTSRRRAAIVGSLAEQLRARGSWCGETHLQKATYFLQELLGVPMEYEFILYKYGPYAFDFHNDLAQMRARGYVAFERQPYPYGPRLALTASGRELCAKFPKTLNQYRGQIAFIADELGAKGVTDLEQLATAMLVTRDPGVGPTVEARAVKLTELKPHISGDVAVRAVEAVDELVAQAQVVAA